MKLFPNFTRHHLITHTNTLSQLIQLQNKAVRIMNDVPLRDYITPRYVHLGLLKFLDVVKIYNCLFLYDYVSDI